MGYFLYALFWCEWDDVGEGGVGCVVFIDFEVVLTDSCYLRQVGDGDDLTAIGSHIGHDMCHLLGYDSADTCVDFIEDNGRQVLFACQNEFE